LNKAPHGGKEADGILGDFILRNNRLHALISGAQPLRRAKMRTETTSWPKDACTIWTFGAPTTIRAQPALRIAR